MKHRDLERTLREEAAELLPSESLGPRIVAAVRAAARDQRSLVEARRRPSRRLGPAVLAMAAAAAFALWLGRGAPETPEAPMVKHRETVAQGSPDLAAAEVPAPESPAEPPPLWVDPLGLLFGAPSLEVPPALGGEALLAEAENLWSDASRAAEDFVRALPQPRLGVGRPQ